MEHEQAAETAHHFTSLLIFAKRLDRTDMQSGAVCRVKAALQEKIEIDSFTAAKLQDGEDIEPVVGEILIPFRRLRFLLVGQAVIQNWVYISQVSCCPGSV